MMKEIAEVFEFVRNGASIKQEEGKSGIPITRIETIWNKTIDQNRLGYADLDKNDLSKYDKYLLQHGDILMTHINSPKHLRKCAMYEGNPEKLVHGMNLLCLRPNVSKAIPTYLKYYFNSEFFKIQLPKIANQSVNQASFSAGNLKKLKIPLPPLPTQKKIASILDAADAYRQKTKALIEKYDELTQSLFLDMFGDPVVNEKGWEKVQLSKLCSFDKMSVKPDDIKEGETYLGLECFEKMTGNILNKFTVHAGELKSNKFWFNKDYILYGKLRPYLNKVAVPTFEGVCSTDIIPIKPIKNITTKEFITSLMRGDWFVSFADERSSGANLPRISPREVEKYRSINPPFPLQNQFAEHVQKIEAQKAQAQESLEKAEELFNSLLGRAFKGEVSI